MADEEGAHGAMGERLSAGEEKTSEGDVLAANGDLPRLGRVEAARRLFCVASSTDDLVAADCELFQAPPSGNADDVLCCWSPNVPRNSEREPYGPLLVASEPAFESLFVLDHSDLSAEADIVW